MDPSWSETGDRYMLKLFRDYVFHQVDENGLPWMDMAHIVQCLNKVQYLIFLQSFRLIILVIFTFAFNICFFN